MPAVAMRFVFPGDTASWVTHSANPAGENREK
jgi:hypothetical protein